MFYCNKRKGLPSFCFNHCGTIYQTEAFIALFIYLVLICVQSTKNYTFNKLLPFIIALMSVDRASRKAYPVLPGCSIIPSLMAARAGRCFTRRVVREGGEGEVQDRVGAGMAEHLYSVTCPWPENPEWVY